MHLNPQQECQTEPAPRQREGFFTFFVTFWPSAAIYYWV
jgi:hypothetical protein